MPRKEPRTLSLELDGRKIYFPEGATVLRAAELNGVDIPSLCSHKDLSPFGGCRLCVVEIEGLRGYPLSCNTTAAEGMKVRTDTPELLELRREFLKLILSEHPSSCLICEEKAACTDYQGTIRKSGVTTGCRFCPNDGTCELQALVDKLGITDIDYPILYHGYEPEHDDPFYDRDYNLCILCGRCVRMCQEVRGSAILAFTFRGPKAKIAPAFGRSHKEAGCEFCGACVDVCPTGALADKASKWDGKPDGTRVSTCPFCAIGCQIELSHRNRRLSKARAVADAEVNDGQLCLKGRFCQPEIVHHFDRAKRPMLMKGEYFREVAWPEALEAVADKLKGVRPDEFAMLVSPDLANESLFAAQRFVRDVLGSEAIDSTGRLELAGGFGLWTRLFASPVSIKAVSKAEHILAVGLDSRFDFSVVGTKVRQAVDQGARLVVIDPRESNLARIAEHWLRPRPGGEAALLKFLSARLRGTTADLAAAAGAAGIDPAGLDLALGTLAAGKDLTVIVGPQVFHYGETGRLAEALLALAGRDGANLIPLYYGTNARGALEMGVFPEAGPGAVERPGGAPLLPGILDGTRRPKVLYLVGDVPFFDRPECDFLIVQDTYLPSFKVDAFLPAASFAEGDGTLINVEGRVQEVAKVEDLPEGAVTGFQRPDWLIFSDLEKALGGGSVSYHAVRDVQADIRKRIPDFEPGNRKPRRMTPPAGPWKAGQPAKPPDGGGGFLLVARPAGYRHRGIDIASKVAGLAELALEEGFRMAPADLADLGLKDGDPIVLSFGDGAAGVPGKAKADPECPPGAVFFTRPFILGGLEHRRALAPLYRLGPNPVAVNISKAGAGPD
jgi:formate dehydrogenase alpha subunit